MATKEQIERKANRDKVSDWRAKNPDSNSKNQRRAMAVYRKRFSPVDPPASYVAVIALFEAQGKRCSICKGDKPKARAGWHIDGPEGDEIDNPTGILCHDCHTLLHACKHNVFTLRAAMAYLTKHRRG